MELAQAGTVWVPEELAEPFRALGEGGTYSFAGTVDQIRRRYYIIVNACYALQTRDDLDEHWVNMLEPGAAKAEEVADASDVVMQALLIEAQNNLIQMAREQGVTVAQLIQSQSDGGHRIAEHIVADSLRGKLRDRGTTADEVMVGAVMALLEKQAVMEQAAQVAEEMAAWPALEPALPEPPDVPMEDVALLREEDAPQPLAPPPEEDLPLPSEAVDPDSDDEVVYEEPTWADLKEEDVVPAPEVLEQADEPMPPPTPAIESDLASELDELELDVDHDRRQWLEDLTGRYPELEDIPDSPQPLDIAPELLESELAQDLADEEEIEPTTLGMRPDGVEEQGETAEWDRDEEGAFEEEYTPEDYDVVAAEESDTRAEWTPAETDALDDGYDADGYDWAEYDDEELIEFGPGPTLDEEMGRAALEDEVPEYIRPAYAPTDAGMSASPPTSMLVVPLAETPAEVVPLVSMEPTRAELAQQRKEEALERQEQERRARAEAARIAAAEKAAASEEAARLRQEQREQRAEARRLARETKRLAAEQKKVERANRKLEARLDREEAAARRAAETEARKETARLEAEAKKALEEKARELERQQREAVAAREQAEALAREQEAAQREREAVERRLAEMEARRAAAEEAIREAEERKQAEVKRIEAEVAAQAAAEQAALEQRIAEEAARQAEEIRIAQEIARQEHIASAQTQALIQEERAAREAAEARLRQMEQEIRELEARTRDIQVAMEQQQEAPWRAVETPPAAPVVRPHVEPVPAVGGTWPSTPVPPDVSPREQRRQAAATRRAEQLAAREAAAAAKARAAGKVPVDPDDLPDWMKPIRY